MWVLHGLSTANLIVLYVYPGHVSKIDLQVPRLEYTRLGTMQTTPKRGCGLQQQVQLIFSSGAQRYRLQLLYLASLLTKPTLKISPNLLLMSGLYNCYAYACCQRGQPPCHVPKGGTKLFLFVLGLLPLISSRIWLLPSSTGYQPCCLLLLFVSVLFRIGLVVPTCHLSVC